MNLRAFILRIIALTLGLLLPAILSAQRGTVTIPIGASITIPQGAVICADTIFANGSGHGALNLADPSGICSGSVIIPVELLMLSATLESDHVLLSWTTATETGNYGFEVQRIAGQGVWTSCGFVEGHGSSTEAHAYQFADQLADLPRAASTLRYRLKQIDLDGRYEYSPEVEIRLDQPMPRFALDGYPTPCDEEYTLRLTLAEAHGTSIRLHDMTGRVMRVVTQEAVLPAGSHSMRIRTADLPSGLYLLVAKSDGDRRTRKVVIRH